MGFPYPYPLGLPKGSVRATITLLLSIDMILLTLNGAETLAESISTMVVVAVTFYFGGRMRGSHLIPRDTSAAQRAWGLPAGSIRSLLFVGFIGLSVFLFINTSQVPAYLQEIVNIIAGYVVGRAFNNIRRRFFPREEGDDTSSSIFDHLKAIGVLLVVGAVFYLTLFDDANAYIATAIFVGSIVLGFYFGERN